MAKSSLLRRIAQALADRRLARSAHRTLDANRLFRRPALRGLDLTVERHDDQIWDCEAMRSRLDHMPVEVREVFLQIMVDKRSVAGVARNLSFSRHHVRRLLACAVEIANGPP